MRLDIFELDGKGIVPQFGEDAESFKKRGKLILQVSENVSDTELTKYLLDCSDEDLRLERCQITPFLETKEEKKEREEDLKYVAEKYGADLSWVRLLSFGPADPIGRFFAPVYGYAVRAKHNVAGAAIEFPMIALLDAGAYVHELIHTIREGAVSCSFKHSEEEDNFEEFAADDGYFESSFLSLSGHRRNFYKIRKKLQRFFGASHGYVFARLDYGELKNVILSDKLSRGDPVGYLKKFSDRYLKYKILLERSGL